MRLSVLTPNALSVAALLTFLAGCSGGGAQTPALSGSANSLGQAFARQVTSSWTVHAEHKPHGFMHAINARTLLYMSSWGNCLRRRCLNDEGEAGRPDYEWLSGT